MTEPNNNQSLANYRDNRRLSAFLYSFHAKNEEEQEINSKRFTFSKVFEKIPTPIPTFDKSQQGEKRKREEMDQKSKRVLHDTEKEILTATSKGEHRDEDDAKSIGK